MPTFQDFQKQLIEKFDFECASLVLGYCSNICDSYKEVLKIIAGMEKFVNEKCKVIPTRKEQAQLILSSFGNTNRSGFVFGILDSKPVDKAGQKKLLYQCLKKD